MTLFPVILPVADTGHNLSGKAKGTRLSKIAREALRLSAEKSGVLLRELLKDENNVPCPFDGNYWSLSHKSKYVTAVVSKKKIGIDIEEIEPRSEAIFARLASEEEWKLCKDRSWGTFFRYWTAKEAILKAVGVGISGFKDCRVASIPDENHIVVVYRDSFCLVEQLYYKNHVISVLRDDDEIEWVIADNFSLP